MRTLRTYRAIGALLIIVFALQVTGLGSARAGMVDTAAVIGSEQSDQRTAISAYLERDEVRAALQAHGVAPGEAIARVAAFSDAEIALIASTIEDDPAGQGLGLVVVAGLVALIVLLVADATGHTDVF